MRAAFFITSIALICGCTQEPAGERPRGTTDFKIAATRHAVAWIVEGTRIPGFDKDYPDAKIMRGISHFLVVCEYLPDNASISNDPRVQRIKSVDQKKMLEIVKQADSSYLTISVIEESDASLRLALGNNFGTLAGHHYQLSFHKTPNGIKAKGKLVGVR